MNAFLLNDWLQRWRNLDMNLAGSTGPTWKLRDLLQSGFAEKFAQTELKYASLGGSEELRQEIAEMHGVDPDWVVVTNGATEALHLICAVLAKPGGHVLLPIPGYPAVSAIAQMHHLSIRTYTLCRDRQFKINEHQILALAAARATAFVVVNTPHNPTGAVTDQSTSLGLARRLEKDAIPLVVDEVFHPVYHGAGGISVAGCANVILVGDLSKALSLPGLRLGWIIDPNAERRSHFRRTRGIISLGGSPLLERLAVIALKGRHKIVKSTAKAAASNLEQFQHFIARHCDILGWVPPEGGLVAFPWFHDGRDTRQFCELLATKGVSLVPGDCFGMQEFMRVGIGCEPEVFEAGLRVIEQELAN